MITLESGSMLLKTVSPSWPWTTICVLLLPIVLSLVRTVLIRTVFSVEKECFFCNQKTTIYVKRNILVSRLLEYVYPLFCGFYCSYGNEGSDGAGEDPIPEPVFDKDGTLRQWFCNKCDSYNVYDEGGNLITPDEQTMRTGLIQVLSRNRFSNPQPFLESETKHFCDKCIENQELNRLSLALVSNEDDYDGNPIIETHLEAQYRRVSERFPVVCSSCSRRVERYITFLNKRLSQRLYNYSLVAKNMRKNTKLHSLASSASRYLHTQNYLRFIAITGTVYLTLSGLSLVKNTMRSYFFVRFADIILRLSAVDIAEMYPHLRPAVNDNYLDITPLTFSMRIIPMCICLDTWLYYLSTRRCLFKFSKKFAIYSSLRTAILLLLVAAAINIGITLKSELNHTAFFVSYVAFALTPIYKTIAVIFYTLKTVFSSSYPSDIRNSRIINARSSNWAYGPHNEEYPLSPILPNESLFWDPVEGWVNRVPGSSTPYPSPEDLHFSQSPPKEYNVLSRALHPPLLRSHKSIAEHIAALHIGSPKPNRIKFS